MADQPKPGSPEAHLHKLLGALGQRARGTQRSALQGVALQRQPGVALLEAYYLGEYQLPWVTKLSTSKYGKVFKDLMASVQDNWMALIVDSTEERLHVEGFRFGSDVADDATWGLWQDNNLDAESELLTTTALTTGTGYTTVWNRPNSTEPLVTIEHPLNMICGYPDASTSEPSMALKSWMDEWTGDKMAALQYPTEVHTFRRVESGWKPLGEPTPNPYGVVTTTEFSVRPFLSRRSITSRGGRSEISEILSTQDQINKLVCDMLVAAEFGAFRQRWASGLELPPGKTDEDAWLEAATNRVWRSGDPETTWGEFAATDLTNFIKAIENRVQSMASRTRTPPHYLLGNSGSFPSGESLRAAETGLIAKVGSRSRHLEEGWERTARNMWLIKGDTEKSKMMGAQTIWRDAESRSESEHIDALGKMRQMLDVPPQALWQRAGFSPQEIAEFRTLLAEWSLFSADIDTPPVPAPVPAPAV